MTKKNSKGRIFVAYHKPFSMLNEDFIVPIHAGRDCVVKNKDSDSTPPNSTNLLHGLIGDNTGDNISRRNNEFNECSVLYWAWKNIDSSELKYVGLFQYRRYLILNDYFDKARKNSEKEVYKCVHFRKIKDGFSEKIGLTEENILKILEKYDCIVPYPTNLAAMKIASPYEDWVRKIPGVHIGDLVELEKIMAEIHPELSDKFGEYLNSPEKRMYQIFIAKPKIMQDYCTWLFDILFKIDRRIDTSLYSINGKRTLGYLAEILYGFYFTYMQNRIKIKECGVAFIEK